MAALRPIAINGRFLTQPMTGAQRFSTETVLAIDRLLGSPAYAHLQGQITIVLPNVPHRSIALERIATQPRGQLSGHLWEQLVLPFLAAGRVLLNLSPVGSPFAGRQYIVVYDATFRAVPQTFSRKARLIYNLIVPMMIRHAAGLATISEFSRREIGRWFGADTGRIALCYCGSDHVERVSMDESVLDRHDLRGKRFLLVVGVGGKNKNLDAVLSAFTAAALPDTLLCIVGKRNPAIHADRADVGNQAIRFLGPVSDAELKALYESALSLVYPSTYEGFGLPPVEAMACGCPVISSDQPALVEIAGGASLHFPVEQTQKLAEHIRRIGSDEALREDLSRRGRARAAQFQWERTARVLLDGCAALR